MISAKSWFNKAIYKNVLHRFKWGSFLYFVILFFAGPFIFLVQKPEEMARQTAVDFKDIESLLNEQTFRIFPILMAIAVPTVVAVMVYNAVHNPRHSVFLHSLPTDRKSNYISLLCGAFTLMIVPVAIITAVFMLLSCAGYGRLIGIVPALRWFADNAFVLIFMFSVASVSAFLTGNGFASAAVNVLLHVLTLVLALAIVTAGDNFIYGFTGEYSFAEFLVDKTPVAWVMENFGQLNSKLKITHVLVYALLAVLMYVFAYFLYKKRKMENCGDVAAFAVFKPILKYTVTACAAIASSAVAAEIDIAGIGFKIFVIAAVSAIVYFASEMLITKSFRVFKAYKGFAVFACCFAAATSFFALTNVFGYETYVPTPDSVKEILLYDWGTNAKPYVTDKAVIENAVEIHKSFIKDIPVFNRDAADGNVLSFTYNLKNGKTVKRQYRVNDADVKKTMNMLFESSDYKMKYTGLKYLNVENLKNVNLVLSSSMQSGGEYAWAMNEDTQPLFEAVKKDVKMLSYDKYTACTPVSFYVNISMSDEENAVQKVFSNKTDYGYYDFTVSMNGYFKNTLEFLSQKGYDTLIKNNILSSDFAITEEPIEFNHTVPYSYTVDCEQITISADDASKVYDEYAFREEKDSEQKYYCLYSRKNDTDNKYDYFIKIPVGELPDYLRKYVK